MHVPWQIRAPLLQSQTPLSHAPWNPQSALLQQAFAAMQAFPHFFVPPLHFFFFFFLRFLASASRTTLVAVTPSIPSSPRLRRLVRCPDTRAVSASN
jgi:hypothetical protein